MFLFQEKINKDVKMTYDFRPTKHTLTPPLELEQIEVGCGLSTLRMRNKCRTVTRCDR